MKLVFIYGPPAVGKLTVARELARQTRLRLFHNHLTVLVARSLFPGHHESHPDPRYSDLLKRLRLEVIQAAAEAGVSTIFTLAYSGRIDDFFVSRLVRAVESNGGTVHFVQLHAPDKVLLARVDSQSRRDIAKLTDPQHLQALLQSRPLHESVPFPDVLHIDTSQVQPAEAATKIINHFQLPLVTK